MRRDLDLIRDLLLAVEAEEPGTPLSFTSFHAAQTGEEPLSIPATGYHVELMLDAGFVDGDVIHSEGSSYLGWTVWRLTNDGADYLDSVRDPKVWRKTKQALAKGGGGAALAMVKQVAQLTLGQMLGIG